MAHQQGNGSENATKGEAETTDRGMFDVMKKHDDKPLNDVAMAEVEGTKEEKKPNLLQKLYHSDGNSSLSSDEEEVDGEKKKKKGLKEKIKQKMFGEKEEESDIKTDKYDTKTNAEAINSDEKKGFLDKIKEKLPGQSKKPEDAPPPSSNCGIEGHNHEDESKDKKGILDKIMEKMPGCHKNEEDKVK